MTRRAPLRRLFALLSAVVVTAGLLVAAVESPPAFADPTCFGATQMTARDPATDGWPYYYYDQHVEYSTCDVAKTAAHYDTIAAGGVAQCLGLGSTAGAGIGALALFGGPPGWAAALATGALVGAVAFGGCNAWQGHAREMSARLKEGLARCKNSGGEHGVSFDMSGSIDDIAGIRFANWTCQDPDQPSPFNPATLSTGRLAPGPHDSSDASLECTTDSETPYYGTDSNSLIWYRDSYAGTDSDGAKIYNRTVWNRNTGEYDVDSVVRKCGPDAGRKLGGLQYTYRAPCLSDCDDPHYDEIGYATMNIDFNSRTFDMRDGWGGTLRGDIVPVTADASNYGQWMIAGNPIAGSTFTLFKSTSDTDPQLTIRNVVTERGNENWHVRISERRYEELGVEFHVTYD